MKISIVSSFFLLIFLLLSCAQAPQKISAPKATPLKAGIPERIAVEGEWERNVSAARKEGFIFIYGSTGMSASRDMLMKEMQERYGLKVELTIGRGAELSAKILSERRVGIYLPDVYLGGASTMVNALIPEKTFEPIEPAFILPEVKDPKSWFEGKFPFFESSRTAFRMGGYVTSYVAVNTTLVKPEEIRSYRDLLHPKWKGKIVFNDPSQAGAGSLAFYFLGVKLMGLDFMRELAKQEPVINREMRLQAEWLALGKYPILLGGTDDPILEVHRAGAPVTMLPTLAEGGDFYAGASHIALFNRAPRPDAARALINWLLSREGQTLWSQNQDEVSLRVDVPTNHVAPHKVPDPKKKYTFDDEESIKTRRKYYSVAAEIFAASLRR